MSNDYTKEVLGTTFDLKSRYPIIDFRMYMISFSRASAFQFLNLFRTKLIDGSLKKCRIPLCLLSWQFRLQAVVVKIGMSPRTRSSTSDGIRRISECDDVCRLNICSMALLL